MKKILILVTLALIFWWFFYTRSRIPPKVLPAKISSISPEEEKRIILQKEELDKIRFEKASEVFFTQYGRKPSGRKELVEKGFISE